MTDLPLSETFGPTFQGEGPHTGRRCSFVRLGLCNLSCEWCDTPFTWDTSRFDVAAECPPTPIAQIHARLLTHETNLVILSGGEPLLHQRHYGELCAPRWEWHVETNGTIAPSPETIDAVHHFTVSPKINTRDPIKKRLKGGALGLWAELARDERAIFKFVLTDPLEDLTTIRNLALAYNMPAESIWLMPEGIHPGDVLEHHRAAVDAMLASGYNTTTRLHTLLWGNERGH